MAEKFQVAKRMQLQLLARNVESIACKIKDADWLTDGGFPVIIKVFGLKKP